MTRSGEKGSGVAAAAPEAPPPRAARRPGDRTASRATEAALTAASTEAIEELRRLRETQVAVLQNGTVAQVTPADPTQPATIPAGVPKLPARFQSTEQIRELTRLVLSTSASEMEKSRVGFWFVDF